MVFAQVKQPAQMQIPTWFLIHVHVEEVTEYNNNL